MKIDVDSAEASRRKLFLPSPITASFASGPIAVLTALLLIDIGKTFGTDVRMTGQINITYSIAAFTFVLTTSALSIRFKHKSLLLTGLVFDAHEQTKLHWTCMDAKLKPQELNSKAISVNLRKS